MHLLLVDVSLFLVELSLKVGLLFVQLRLEVSLLFRHLLFCIHDRFLLLLPHLLSLIELFS